MKKQLGYSPLTKTIQLARMKDMGNGIKQRIGNEYEDVTNIAAQYVYQLVRDEGGQISWTVDGKKWVLTATEETP